MPKKKKETKNICGAKNRNGTPCQLQAGWGTNHPGTGRCKYHGGASNGAPKGNSNAKKHGLYSKYFPSDTLELFNALEEENPIDILWNNIKIQYAAIILAQKKMRTILENSIDHESKDGMILISKGQLGWSGKSTIEEKKERSVTQSYESESLEFERYIQAQSRAMATLNSMIKSHDDLCKSDKATEEQQERINKLKADINKVNAEIDKLQGADKDEDENTIQDFLDASKPDSNDVEGLYG